MELPVGNTVLDEVIKLLDFLSRHDVHYESFRNTIVGEVRYDPFNNQRRLVYGGTFDRSVFESSVGIKTDKGKGRAVDIKDVQDAGSSAGTLHLAKHKLAASSRIGLCQQSRCEEATHVADFCFVHSVERSLQTDLGARKYPIGYTWKDLCWKDWERLCYPNMSRVDYFASGLDSFTEMVLDMLRDGVPVPAHIHVLADSLPKR
jgi:hypothetical protein